MSSFNYSGMPIQTFRGIDDGNTLRPASLSVLGVDSEDRFDTYQQARTALGNNTNWSQWDFTINKSQSILTGFFTRIALSEVMVQWGIPNINVKTNQIVFRYGLSEQIITLNPGFYTPSALAAAIQASVRTIDPSLAAFTMTYGIRTTPPAVPVVPPTPAVPTVVTMPVFEYASNVAGPGLAVGFGPMPVNNIRYKPTTKQLFDLMGFSLSNQVLSFGFAHGQSTFCTFTKYIDIVSTQITQNASLKDSSTSATPRDLVARLYLTNDADPSNVVCSSPSFCPVGCAPFTLYRDFATPKQIQMNPTAPIGGFLKFQVFDDSGDFLYEVDTPIDPTLDGTGNNLDWSMTLLASEN